MRADKNALVIYDISTFANRLIFFLVKGSVLITVVVLGMALFSCRKTNIGNTAIPPVIHDTIPQVPDPVVYIQKAASADINNNCGGFYEALPPGYGSSVSAYPLLVFLHGGGELGNGGSELPLVLKNGLPKLLDKKEFPSSFEVNGISYSFIVISPQFKAWPKPEDVHAVVNYAKGHYRVDASRIYIVGLSMGGGATWEYAANYGSSVAAMTPISGASWPDSAIAKKIALANVPAWAFHNQGDEAVPVESTLHYVNMINFYKPDPLVRMTIWPSAEHDAWTRATDPDYKEDGKNIYEWMLQYKR